MFHIEISNQQAALALRPEFPEFMARALEKVGRRLKEENKGLIVALEAVEVTLLDDAVMGRVHGDFLQDASTTDVITFEHGELLLGVEVAGRQRADYGHSLEREIFLYGIHGLLHLSAYDDIQDADRVEMWARQDELLREFGENFP